MMSLARTFVLALVLASGIGACNSDEISGPSNPATERFDPSLAIDLATFTKRPSGVYAKDEAPGSGRAVVPSDRVRIHYVGYLSNGQKFDSSRDRGSPFEFRTASAAVVPGFDDGVIGMRVGGRRRIIIPSDLGYGPNPPQGSPIPPNATLIFDLELLAITTPATASSAP